MWRLKVTRTLIIAASLVVFVTAGHFAATAVIETQQSKQLRELTDVALRRSEVAIDYGAVTLDDIIKRGPVNCEPGVLQAMRFQVYQRSAIKDIRFVNRDGSVICSAYSETLEFDSDWAGRPAMLPSRDGRLLLFQVNQFEGVALGVLRDIDERNSLVAIVATNSGIFDIMPAELRDHSEVLLRLSSGLNAGGFSPARDGKISDSLDFTKISARYPIRATIRVETGALGSWHREGYGPAMLLALALGLAFGFILAKALGNASPLGDLDRALALNQFKPYFQPIFDLRTGAITGCEVLARWVRSDGTIVPPMSFIPLAESSGKIEQITWRLLKTALGEMYPRLRQDKHFKLSLNIVPRHLLKAGFVEDLRQIVAEARVSPRQIVLEVTERDELPDLEKAAAVVKDLRELGFRVAMDDVGVGHSGLSQMKGLGANTIKIDKFFVDTITKESSAVTIVEMLARLALELKMTVVAEGIETPEQIASLLACGIHEGQGYIVSPPLPFAKFDELLVKRQSGAVAGKPTLENALVA